MSASDDPSPRDIEIANEIFECTQSVGVDREELEREDTPVK